MESSPVHAAYVPFAQTLRAGGFSEPAAGWNASQVGAINWDFATHTDIVVDRVAVSAVPEPTTAAITGAVSMHALLRRRRTSHLTSHNSQRNLKLQT